MFFDFYRSASQALFRQDRHLLAGVVTVDGQPGRRLVCLFDRKSQYLEAAVWSRADGSFTLSGLPEYPARRLMAVAYDTDAPPGSGKFNAEVADMLTQVAPAPFVPPAPEQ